MSAAPASAADERDAVAFTPAPLDRSARVYVAGHRGLVGSAIVRRLEAEGFTDKLDEDVIAERVEHLTALAEELSAQRAEERVGQEVLVLVESVAVPSGRPVAVPVAVAVLSTRPAVMSAWVTV